MLLEVENRADKDERLLEPMKAERKMSSLENGAIASARRARLGAQFSMDLNCRSRYLPEQDQSGVLRVHVD